MHMRTSLISPSLALGLFFVAASCWAQPARPEGSGTPPPPPPEAVAACKGKTQGVVVSFTGRRGETVSGTCEKIGDVLAARPSGPPPGGGKPPSP